MADLTKTGHRPLQAALIQHTKQQPFTYTKPNPDKNNKKGPKTKAECISNLRKKINNLKA